VYTKKDLTTIRSMILDKIPSTVRIILFGSYARGTSDESSDMDFIILTEKNLNREEKLSSLSELRWQAARSGFNADFLLKDEDDYLSELELPTLSRVISQEGVELWNRG